MNPYDRVFYPTGPNPRTLPARLGALARLRGRRAVPPAEARVLDIGCGNGGNLLSIAAIAPGAECVGFDLAELPLEDGRSIAREAGLRNVTLRGGDILDPRAVEGPFDYIIAHGIYAWVPAPVRAGMMALIGRHLSADGLAFVSYNVAPGGSLRQTLRTVLRDQLPPTDDPGQRIAAARETLEYFLPLWEGSGPHGDALAEEARRMLERDPHVLFHDELGDVFEPQLFSDMVGEARANGLGYLCEANPALSPVGSPADPDLVARAGGDPILAEQLSDFVSRRPFRESVLCRADTAPSEAGSNAALPGLFARARLRRTVSGSFSTVSFAADNGAEFDTDDTAFAQFLLQLAGVWPACMPIPGALAATDAGDAIVQLVDTGAMTLLTSPLPLVRQAGERPVASPLARAQAARGERQLYTLQHAVTTLPDEGATRFVGLLDGTRTRAELAPLMGALGVPAGVGVDQMLDMLALSGLLAA